MPSAASAVRIPVSALIFDVLSSQEAFYDSATAYIQGLIDLDAARYTLLSKTGELLSRLGIAVDPNRIRP